MKTSIHSIFSLCVLTVCAFPYTADAASLYIDPAQSSLNRGDALTFAVRLDTDEAVNECVNAVDAVITYTANIDPVDVSIGNSIFSMWVEQPTINREDRTITFAGGIPNGYCGRVTGDPQLTNVMAELIFRSPGFAIGGSGEPVARVAFADTSTAYLNDGQGSKASLTTYGAEIAMNDRPGAEMQNPWQDRVDADTVRPEEFSISLEQDETTFSGRHYIVFNTTDKQTGIDHYEVMEEPISQFNTFEWGRADAPWIKARSPYELDDQSLNSIIRVKAVDKAGNQYIATLIPDESMRTLSQDKFIFYVFVTFLGLVLLLVLLSVFLWYRKMRRRTPDSSGEPEQQTENDQSTDAHDTYD